MVGVKEEISPSLYVARGKNKEQNTFCFAKPQTKAVFRLSI